jgi:hypothetical protein
VRDEERREQRGVPTSQHIDWASAFQVDEDRRVVVAPALREVVDADDAHPCGRPIGQAAQ